MGRAVARFLGSNPSNQIAIYDKFVAPYDDPGRKQAVNACDIVFVCVPTPAAAGESCDLSAVEESAGWITAPLCIRSTVAPGTVERLSAAYGRAVAFSPEYLGESPAHPWKDDAACGFVIVGGADQIAGLVTAAYRTVVGPEVRFYYTDSRTAELCKYMENCFLATKVAFVNQFYDIAEALGVPFEELREVWLADPRIGSSHTQVSRERGFRGRCLPKDLSAMIAAMKALGGAPLLEQVLAYNLGVCARADRARKGGAGLAVGDGEPELCRR